MSSVCGPGRLRAVVAQARALCPQPAKKKRRAQVMEFFIDAARECFNIGNFNSLMAIVCEWQAWAWVPARAVQTSVPLSGGRCQLGAIPPLGVWGVPLLRQAQPP